MPFRGKIGDISEILRSGEKLSIEWKIKDFLTLSSAGVDFYESPEFSLGDEQWFLSIWPSGMTWASFDWVDLYLFRKASGRPETLDVSVSIKGSDPAVGKKRKRHEFSSKDDGCGWLNFYLRSSLQSHKSSLMPDEVLTITCDIKRYVPNRNPSRTNDEDVLYTQETAIQVEALADGESQSSEAQDDADNTEAPIQVEALSSESKTENRDYAADQEIPIQTESLSGESQTENQDSLLNRHGNVIRCLKALLTEGRRSDFTLKLGGREWALHKMILESRSRYFADMFCGEWAESAVGEFEDVITEDALDCVLQFIYTGEIDEVYVEDLCDLYLAAHKCQMEDLKPLCVDSMKENMCAEIVCGALAIAKIYKEDELNKVALDYFVQEADRIFEMEEWEELKLSYPEILVELLEESARRGKVIG